MAELVLSLECGGVTEQGATGLRKLSSQALASLRNYY